MDLPTLAQGLLVVLDLLALPQFLMLLAIVLGAFFARRRRPLPAGGPRSRFLLITPAHNEESGIAATVRSALASDYPRDQFDALVIADNCDDRTAEVAREAGAIVFERFDATRKSKGYAIEDTMARLQAEGTFDRYDALVIVDADSLIDADLLARFDAHLQRGEDWVQCYDIVGNADASWRTRLMAYSFALINGVMLLGQSAIGLGAGLRGNGMCLTTRGLRRHPWRTHGLAEDLEFSWGLRTAGERIAFEPDAAVHATMLVTAGRAAAGQRRRWEYGRQELKRKFFWAIARSPSLGLLRKVGLLLELTMPPMATLGAVALSLSLANGLAFAMSGHLFFLAVLAVIAAATGLYAVGPFLLFGLPWRFAWSLIGAPYYAAWKLLVMAGGKPGSWIRTAREQPSPAAATPRP